MEKSNFKRGKGSNKMKKYSKLILFFVIILGISTYSKEITSIEIKPEFTAFDSLPSIKTNLRYKVVSVRDTSSERENKGIVGLTKISRKKSASIICKESPSTIFKKSLEGMLKSKGVATEESDSNTILIEIVILDFSIKESEKKFTQSMDANIEFELIIKYNNDTPERKFIIKSQNTKSALDTTKHAESVLRGALKDALQEIIKVINR